MGLKEDDFKMIQNGLRLAERGRRPQVDTWAARRAALAAAIAAAKPDVLALQEVRGAEQDWAAVLGAELTKAGYPMPHHRYPRPS